MIALQDLPIRKIKLEDMPTYFRFGAFSKKSVAEMNANVFIQCGAVKPGGNESYCYAQEKECAGHICRVLRPERTISHVLAIRDDGTVWDFELSPFQMVERIEVI